MQSSRANQEEKKEKKERKERVPKEERAQNERLLEESLSRKRRRSNSPAREVVVGFVPVTPDRNGRTRVPCRNKKETFSLSLSQQAKVCERERDLLKPVCVCQVRLDLSHSRNSREREREREKVCFPREREKVCFPLFRFHELRFV